MFLFVDIETSGLLVRDIPRWHPQQPWAVSMSFILLDRDLTEIAIFSGLIAPPDERVIQPKAEGVHGVSIGMARRYGVSQISALGLLIQACQKAQFVLGWGIEFDREIIAGSLERLKKDPKMWVRPGLEDVDVMKAAAPFCMIETDHESQAWKWPSLDEAGEILLKEPRRAGFHHPLDDLRRTIAVWKLLREKGAFGGEEEEGD